MEEQQNNEKVIPREISKEQQFDNFRMFHELQYDRIDKLETRRETFSNFIITISSGIYLIQPEDLTSINIIIAKILPLPIIVVLINISAIIFAYKSRLYVKMHQERAKKAREKYAPKLNKINSLVGKPDSKNDYLRRNRLYQYLHIALILMTLCLMFSSKEEIQNKSINGITPEAIESNEENQRNNEGSPVHSNPIKLESK